MTPDPRQFQRRRQGLLLALALLLPASLLLGAASGAYYIPPLEIPRVLQQGLEGASVLLNLRFPRVLLAALVGGTLALSGAVLQGLLRTPLAEPGLVGLGLGAAFGAVLWLAFFPLAAWGLPLAAALGVLGVLGLLLRLVGEGEQPGVRLLLMGLLLGSVLSALIGFLQFRVGDPQGRSLTFWTLGSLGGASWELLALTAPLALLSGVLLLGQSRALNALTLGEEEAFHLGISVGALRWRALLLVALGVGAAVGAAGNIAFVGLLVPWLLRALGGADHRFVLPAAWLLGASLTVLADLAARTLFAPAELPVGLLTTLVGGPLFLYLFARGGWRG
ncbi:MAG: iron ABC transporter permease [Meiothermus sp.]|uniref:FecCD family ABC transporter permease n=1 Tax=Meiothermus sp. TaxID=1955249 RepID=UPI0025E1BDF8|nr:iron ABC transporter permease [Meiothermus sp.]MCS7069231.1 iron ABC transporter permease [Meiothermus sp.]MDW8424327.1 iron ABC transporter permease [Meiothermus sp.]